LGTFIPGFLKPKKILIGELVSRILSLNSCNTNEFVILECSYFAQENWHKNAFKKVDEIDCRCQFHQHFLSSFFVQNSYKRLLITKVLVYFFGGAQ
jgi:hypothetical protein